MCKVCKQSTEVKDFIDSYLDSNQYSLRELELVVSEKFNVFVGYGSIYLHKKHRSKGINKIKKNILHVKMNTHHHGKVLVLFLMET